MSVRDAVAGALLAGGVAVQVLACVGVLVARDAFDRLHLAAPAAMLGVPLVSAAILVNESFSQGGIKAIATAVAVTVTVPVLGHAIARAARERERR